MLRETASDSAALRLSGRTWIVVASCIATTIAVLQTVQIMMGYGRAHFPLTFALELPVWFTWILLFPVISCIALRFPLSGSAWKRHLPIHVVASVAASLSLLTISTLGRAIVAHILLFVGLPLTSFEDQIIAAAASPMVTLPYAIRVYFVFPVLLYFAVVAFHDAMLYSQTIGLRRAREAELEALLAKSQLEALKSQLHPHFLFNSLNTISALVVHDPLVARRVIGRLSDLLRYALKDDGHTVPLADELSFLQGYVEIQNARFREQLQVQWHIDDGVESVRVPRMVLQPLVENAIRHGANMEGEMVVDVSAARENGHLRLSVSDTGPGFPAASNKSTGIGLANTRERLASLYGDGATLRLGTNAAGGACVSIELPLPAPA
ncbi:MAG: LytTr DNA-binding region [Gemmatimonadetes bacterium]|nr:LytTr DNA-binding region [Gemmatimonadota bacterium]